MRDTTTTKNQLSPGVAAMLRHDVDGVLAAGDEVNSACEACHDKYMPARIAARAATR